MKTSAKFLEYLSSRWRRDIPIKCLWVLHIDDLSRIGKSVANILRSTETRGQPRWPISRFADDQDPYLGMMIAQSFSGPTDSHSVSNSENTNYGGLRPGYYSTQREPYGQINVEFLETNVDFIDYFIRPWIIAGTYKGLIEDGDRNTDIKARLTVRQFTRVDRRRYNLGPYDMRGEFELRKSWVYEGVVPVSAEGERLRQDSFNTSDIIKSTAFVFSNYYSEVITGINEIGGSDLGGRSGAINLAYALQGDGNSILPAMVPAGLNQPNTGGSGSAPYTGDVPGVAAGGLYNQSIITPPPVGSGGGYSSGQTFTDEELPTL